MFIQADSKTQKTKGLKELSQRTKAKPNCKQLELDMKTMTKV